VIVADECYSEIYFDEARPPLGALAAAKALGREGYPRLVSVSSLSKRSSAPGLRSGFATGDRKVLEKFLLYRTYHGSAMNPVIQQASIAAWGDEAHVVANRDKYRAKFAQVTPMLAEVMQVALPDAGFYLWADISSKHPDDVAYSLALLAQYNVAVLPGSLLARDSNGVNPGAGRIRLALVAEVEECVEAARRIQLFAKDFATSQPSARSFQSH
jgi:N-succinyldiaminopimelate aminotransferase